MNLKSLESDEILNKSKTILKDINFQSIPYCYVSADTYVNFQFKVNYAKTGLSDLENRIFDIHVVIIAAQSCSRDTQQTLGVFTLDFESN